MARFSKKLGLFLLPLLIVFGPILAVLLRSGELSSIWIDSVVDGLRSGKVRFYGPAYTDCSRRYKLRGVQIGAPSVLALGTSRALQFRADFFREPSKFYNAARGVARVRDLRHFLDDIPQDRTPKVLIVGLDQFFFNPRWDDGQVDDFEASVAKCNDAIGVFQSGLRELLPDVLSGKKSFSAMLRASSADTIGLTAAVYREGFRADGSYRYARVMDDPTHAEDFQFRDTLKRIAAHNRRFERADSLLDASINEVDAFISAAEKRGIHVVGFIPPYAPGIYERMQRDGSYHAYFESLAPRLSEIFARHHAVIGDFTNPETLHVTDDQFIDGYHGSEQVYARMLLALSTNDATLAAVVKPAAALEAMMTSSPSKLAVLPDDR